MSSHHRGARRGAPRVSVVRGVATSDVPVQTSRREELPTAALDPLAIEAIKEQAHEEGLRLGYEEGMQLAQQEMRAYAEGMQAEYESALGALFSAVEDLRSRQTDSLHHVADQTALLALQIAEVVLERELTTAENPGRDAIARALPLVPEDGNVRVKLNPADMHQLGDVSDLLPGRQVEILGDASVGVGGAIVSVGATQIDAQVDTALERVKHVLR